jgi:signal transduction histidine kinase
MSARTLAGRVSWTQSGLTLIALAAVIAGTAVAARILLDQQTDSALEETIERVGELTEHVTPADLDARRIEDDIDEARPSEVRVELADDRGHVLASSGPGPSFAVRGLGCVDHDETRVCTARVDHFTVIAAVDRSADLDAKNRALTTLVVVAAAIGALVSILSHRVARRALAPLTKLATRIAQIAPGEGTRLSTPSRFAELEALRVRFDELVARYDEALARERRLTAQASHELRTPLAVARAEIESLGDAHEIVAGRGRALAALDRLAELVEALLWFARAQRRLDHESVGIVNVADVLREQLNEHQRSHDIQDIAFALPDEALIRGDEKLLGRVTANLLDNAVKYGDGRSLDVSARRENGLLRVRVRNSGTPPDLAERVFEPFYRASPRSQQIPGFGLGLPFARAVARAHGGDIELMPSAADATEFDLTLPLIDWSDPDAMKPR